MDDKMKKQGSPLFGPALSVKLELSSKFLKSAVCAMSNLSTLENRPTAPDPPKIAESQKQLPAQTYGQRLRHERELRGWTRDELAEMLGVYKTYIGRWEREERLPSYPDQQKLCELLGKTAQELGISDAPDQSPPYYRLTGNETDLFGLKLKHEREARGWSQAGLALALEVPYPNISRWERGETLPTHGYWQKLTELFGKTVQELGLVPNMPEQETIAGSAPNYGQRLKYHRKLKAWDQKRLAREVGTTARSIVRWEQGETLPELRFQQRLCELFGKDPEELGFIQKQVELTDIVPLPVHTGITPNALLLRQRQVRGWTQRDVAEKLGTYLVNISRWERGEATPDQDFQRKLCELFRCGCEELGLSQVDFAVIDELHTS